MDLAISHKSVFRASVTKVAFIRSPAAVAGGSPAGVFGVVALCEAAAAAGDAEDIGNGAPGGSGGGGLSEIGRLVSWGEVHELPVPGKDAVGIEEDVKKYRAAKA